MTYAKKTASALVVLHNQICSDRIDALGSRNVHQFIGTLFVFIYIEL